MSGPKKAEVRRSWLQFDGTIAVDAYNGDVRVARLALDRAGAISVTPSSEKADFSNILSEAEFYIVEDQTRAVALAIMELNKVWEALSPLDETGNRRARPHG